LWRGRTLGKAALGLRVVRDDGGPIVFRHALVRGLVGALVDFGITLGAGALISSLLSDRGKRIGDIAAGTVVIQERVPSARGPMAHMPPPLAAWAATADLSRVPDDLALAARQFISRQHDLDPQIRESMGSRLVADVAAVVAPPPPPGTPGWAYLAAVLAERRRRSEQQLASRQPPPVAPSPVTAPPSSGVVQAPPVAPTPAAAEPPPAGPFAPPA
jgi:hypothetical protein